MKLQQMKDMEDHEDADSSLINLGDRRIAERTTTLGSALLTARIKAMSYDNQAPLRGIKTATMNPYQAPEHHQNESANIWKGKGKQAGAPGPGAVPVAATAEIRPTAGAPVAARPSKSNDSIKLWFHPYAKMMCSSGWRFRRRS